MLTQAGGDKLDNKENLHIIHEDQPPATSSPYSNICSSQTQTQTQTQTVMRDDLMQTGVQEFSSANQTRAAGDFIRSWFRSHTSVQNCSHHFIQNEKLGQSCCSDIVMEVPIAATSLPMSDLEYRCKVASPRLPVFCDTLRATAGSRGQ